MVGNTSLRNLQSRMVFEYGFHVDQVYWYGLRVGCQMSLVVGKDVVRIRDGRFGM